MMDRTLPASMSPFMSKRSSVVGAYVNLPIVLFPDLKSRGPWNARQHESENGASGHDVGSARTQRTIILADERVPRIARMRSIGFRLLRDTFCGVVDDEVGAERAHDVQVPGAAHARHLGTEGFRYLHGEGSDAAGGSVDQDLLALCGSLRARRPCRATRADWGTPAASSNERAAGFGASAPSSAQTNSASAPYPHLHVSP